MRWALLVLLLVGCIRPPITGYAVAVPGNDSLMESHLPTVEPTTITPRPTLNAEEVAPVSADAHRVNLTATGMAPRELTVAQGSTIYWINYARSPRQIKGSAFQSPILRPGQAYHRSFEEIGQYAYHERDRWGRITVVEPKDKDVHLVRITPFAYAPKELRITVGDTVRWNNTDVNSHTVTGAGFDSQSLRHDETFSHTFDRAGAYPYGDTYQGHLLGLVVVTQ